MLSPLSSSALSSHQLLNYQHHHHCHPPHHHHHPQLEIHNDAYSNWGSEAKFFRWSLKLYGTQSDPNSERPEDRSWYPEDADQESPEEEDFDRRNVVREARLEPTEPPPISTTT